MAPYNSHRQNPTPVAVLNQDGAASRVQQVGPPREVEELAAAVQLDAIVAVAHHSIDIAVHMGRDIGEVVLRATAMKSRGEVGDMTRRSHCYEPFIIFLRTCSCCRT